MSARVEETFALGSNGAGHGHGCSRSQRRRSQAEKENPWIRVQIESRTHAQRAKHCGSGGDAFGAQPTTREKIVHRSLGCQRLPRFISDGHRHVIIVSHGLTRGETSTHCEQNQTYSVASSSLGAPAIPEEICLMLANMRLTAAASLRTRFPPFRHPTRPSIRFAAPGAPGKDPPSLTCPVSLIQL
jgi:hypothetical protein